MFTFKDEDLGLTYTAETVEELEQLVRVHEDIRSKPNLAIDASPHPNIVVKNISPIQTPSLDGLGVGKSIRGHNADEAAAVTDEMRGYLGAGPSIEQGDEGVPIPAGWLSPRQISVPQKGSPDAETEALAEAYQLQEHRQLQQEVQRLRAENQRLFEEMCAIEKANKAISGIEFVGQQAPTESFESICGKFKAGMTLADELSELQKARASLNHFNLDTSGIDKMLAQHGIHYHSAPPITVRGLGGLMDARTPVMIQQGAANQMQSAINATVNAAPSKADVRMFQLWERFLEIMDANGFGDTPGEDRTSPDSYLSALEKWLVAFVQGSEQLQEERRKSAHLLHEKENCQRQVHVFGAQADGMRKELAECKTEIVALKKGISKLQKKRDSLKSKHESELTEAISNHELCKAELKRLGDLYREMQDQRDQEQKMREAAVNDNIELSKRSKALKEKLDFCLKAVPTLEGAWQAYCPVGADLVKTS